MHDLMTCSGRCPKTALRLMLRDYGRKVSALGESLRSDGLSSSVAE